MADREKHGKGTGGEKTTYKDLGFGSFTIGGPAAEVDVNDGKILRIRPLHLDAKYKPEEFRPWKIEAHGKTFEPSLKTLISPLQLAYKKRTFSPNRLLYPLKRVDWDPRGDRNPQNRGVSGYVRISWDEALDIIASELKRIKEKYGLSAVLAQGDGHGESKVVHSAHGCQIRLLKLLGGFTLQARNADSWEGWYWGTKHVWGGEPVGQMMPQTNIVPDIAQNGKLLLYQGADPETTTWGWGGQMASCLMYWFTELGIRQIFICPDLNYAAAVHADKWIPVLPNTDAALQLAIAYVWITEGTYDKEYVATHTVGFDKVRDYVLGKEDGIPKTPRWAEPLCGVPSRIIKALAREWASKPTSTVHCNGGPYIRGPYATEPARLEAILLGMQGLGKPGTHHTYFSTLSRWTTFNVPQSEIMPDVQGAYRGYSVATPGVRAADQIIPELLIHDAILNPPISWYGTTVLDAGYEDLFIKYTYPAKGCSEIHMIWTDTPCLITCWNDGNAQINAYRSPKIEFLLAQHPWFENDCLFADIVLPSNTKLEVEDLGADRTSANYRSLFLEDKCVDPLGESRSDYEVVCAVAERMGLLKEYTEGKSVPEWIKYGFETSGVQNYISWEEFKEKGYFVVPTDKNWKSYPAGLFEFYKDPVKNPLTTSTGKLQFYCQRLAESFPDDDERPPYPKWIPYGKSHQESRLLPRAKKYPLLVMSNHPRWGVHANHDDVTWFREIETGKVRGPDGYQYHPVWIHPSDAAKRGIENGDVVKVYNERGAVLCGAYVTERILPGAISVDHGAKYDPIVPGELDRGGAINTITPHNMTSPNSTGMVVSGFLAEVNRVDVDELRRQYPEAFKRRFHAAAGPIVDSFLYGGG